MISDIPKHHCVSTLGRTHLNFARITIQSGWDDARRTLVRCSFVNTDNGGKVAARRGGGRHSSRARAVVVGMTADPRIPYILLYVGEVHVGLSPTRCKLHAPSAKRREMFGESHKG